MGSVFKEYFTIPEKIKDRKAITNEQGIDVIIPLLNTNELWERNLFNFYERIPINRLLLGDGGCTDESIEIAGRFPRVTVYNHRTYKSQGYSIRKLIEAVETEWFIYLHADVFLPEGWFEEMLKSGEEFDFFECRQKLTTLVEFFPEEYAGSKRALSGSQMGRKAAFTGFLDKIEDDFLQRNEDIIFSELVRDNGFRYGRTFGAFHFHQVMNKRGDLEPELEKVIISKKNKAEWLKKIWNMQARGIIKYLDPREPYLVENVNFSLHELFRQGDLNWEEFKKWTKKTNPKWIGHIHYRGTMIQRISDFIDLVKRMRQRVARKNK